MDGLYSYSCQADPILQKRKPADFLPPKSEWPPGEARVCWNLEDNFCSQSDHRFVQIIQETWQKLPKNYEKILNIRIRCSTSLFTIYRQYYSFCRLSSMAHAEGCNFLAEPKDSTWSCNVGAMRGAQLVAAKSSWNTKVLRKFHINKCWNKNNIPNGSTKNKKWVSLHWQV